MADIFYREKGKGHPLLLIHGFCESHAIWEPIEQALSEHFRVLLIDLPGSGNSPLPKVPFSLDDIATHIWRWLDSLKVDEPIVIGHSLGGYITLAMAAQRPSILKGFGLFQSTALPDSDEKKDNRNKVIDFVSKNGVDPFIDTLVPGLFYNKSHPAIRHVDALCRQTKKETLLAYTAAMRDRPGRQDIVANFEKPVLIIAGEQDGIIPLDSLKNQAKSAKKAHFIILPESAHMAMYEAPRQAEQAIIEFALACLSGTF